MEAEIPEMIDLEVIEHFNLSVFITSSPCSVNGRFGAVLHRLPESV